MAAEPPNADVLASFARKSVAELDALIETAQEAYTTRTVVTRSVLGRAVTINPEVAEENLVTFERARALKLAEEAAEEDPGLATQAEAAGHNFNFSRLPLRP